MSKERDMSRMLSFQRFYPKLKYAVRLWPLVIALLIIPSRAATFSAASCAGDDVQSAIDSAETGDTVLIPSGQCAWSNSLVVPDTKRIRLRGAGLDQTIITPNANQYALRFYTAGQEIIEISNLTFAGGAEETSIIQIRGEGRFRIHDLRFTNNGSRVMISIGAPNQQRSAYGVVDHCRLEGYSGKQLVHVLGGDRYDWATPMSFGGLDAVYIESNAIAMQVAQAGAGCSDATGGARVVFRHNHVVNSFLGTHGNCSGNQGSILQLEAYGNSFEITDGKLTHFVLVRGGTGVIYDNQMQGDVNAAVHLTHYAACPSMASFCGFQCTTYPCEDQVGRGTNQALVPYYSWNNTLNGNADGMEVQNLCQEMHEIIQENRDFYNGTQKPEYAPLVYPHPYVQAQGSSALSPPQNLQVLPDRGGS